MLRPNTTDYSYSSGFYRSQGVREGEWQVRQHGSAQRRTWRKLHLGVDEATGEILTAMASTNNVSDGAALPELLQNIVDEIEQVSADGAYDQRSCYDAIADKQAQAAIPPRQGARIQKQLDCHAHSYSRDENLRRIHQIGRAKWQRQSNYHRRSIVENTIFRLKSLFGGKLRRRCFEQQAVELFLQCAVLNRMIQVSNPDTYKVER